MARLLAIGTMAALLTGCGSTATVTPPAPATPKAAPRPFMPVGTPGAAATRGAPAAAAADVAHARAKPARFRIARVVRPTALRATPGGRVLAHLGTATEFGSAMILSVSDARHGWLEVRSAALPNGHYGWIREADTTRHGTDYAIVVNRGAHMATLRHHGHDVFSFAVAVGRPGNETPLGHYAVTDKLRTTDASSPYGCCALALTGHQTLLEPGWPGGDRLAIHGTPDETSVGQAVSLGCMRAYRDVLRKLLKRVPLGAPVVVRA
ncbi:MAG: hypothetical protein QOF76_2140 [Solirubrobacteraceae bacterium]|jgi:lipoprotein-anchoring transpeptidase ErfK/SrfK|nr:hypothetical protein [Solirubrobacteraceae bacterium]